jgi:hypothetical protein
MASMHRLRVALALAAIASLAPLAAGPARAQSEAQSGYLLYYAVQIPPLLKGYSSTDCTGDQAQIPGALCQSQEHAIYTGELNGTLGGLPIQRATLTFRPGASSDAGGGEFALQTAAGAIEKGIFLMTTDGRQTTLVFFGTYLGARIQFHLSGAAKDFPLGTLDAKGVAQTNFSGHTDYIAAVTKGVANLPQAAKAQVIGQANGNPVLVSAYQRTTGAP